MATTDKSRWTQCQAEKTGDIEQITRGQDKKKGRANQRKSDRVSQQRERTGGQHLADFATLSTAVVKVDRAKWYGEMPGKFFPMRRIQIHKATDGDGTIPEETTSAKRSK